MTIKIQETFQHSVANLDEMVHSFNESTTATKKRSKGLVIEIAAIHVGTTRNANYYSEAELHEAAPTWTTPFPKPIIINHDLDSDPLGRVIGATVESPELAAPFIKTQAAITDPVAIERVIDKRYLTVSIGATAESAICSICETDWAKPTERRGLPCEHRFGSVYEGVTAVRKLGGLNFHELSFVNSPSDQNAIVQSVASASESFDFSPRAYQIDLVEPKVQEFNLSTKELTDLEVPKSMSWQLKGAFLSAEKMTEGDFVERFTTIKEDINQTGDSHMAKIDDVDETEITSDEEEADILDVIDSAEATDEVAEDTEQKEEELQDDEDSEDEAEQPAAEEPQEDSDVTVDAEDDEDSVDTEEARKKAVPKDDEAKDSPDGSDAVSGNDIATDAGLIRDESEKDSETDGQVAEDETEPEPEPDSAEHLEADEAIEPAVSELQDKVQTLEDRVERLTKALHKSLVERIVDAKLYRGLVSEDNRAEAIQEHLGRTASSLVDTLKDLRAIPSQQIDTKALREKFNQDILALAEANTELDDEDIVVIDESESLTPAKILEDKWTDQLMGRTPYAS